MRRWLIETLGGYPDIASVLEEIRATDGAERRALLTMAVKRLYNMVGQSDVLRVHESGAWLWKGKPLSQAQIKSLRAEATQFRASNLWEVLAAELRYTANRSMYLNSEDIPDLTAGKMLVYYIDVVESRLKAMVNTDK